jgi:hypothetical protein
MNRTIAIVGAPTSIGIRTCHSGEPRHLDRAPGVFRELGLVQRLRASDLGDVIPPAYRDYVRPRFHHGKVLRLRLRLPNRKGGWRPALRGVFAGFTRLIAQRVAL